MGDKEDSEYVTNLAKERTRLARERTSLAHIRTGFASFLFGIGMLGLFETRIAHYFSVFFISVGVLFLLTSTVSYITSSERTKKLLDIGNMFSKDKKERD